MKGYEFLACPSGQGAPRAARNPSISIGFIRLQRTSFTYGHTSFTYGLTSFTFGLTSFALFTLTGFHPSHCSHLRAYTLHLLAYMFHTVHTYGLTCFTYGLTSFTLFTLAGSHPALTGSHSSLTGLHPSHSHRSHLR